ncbi:uncharacterized protein LOC110465964 [Mizuhopecten yessoensis]|uniref:Uncharacterized protein n=1 Tax=Mizuhopecten yessoensis TaxID=6573 RepID=A0A210PQE2_MIZYE|nr:uncharacterized protein LOC110465964 [Mizuhopecten yessoensis]OWF38703.1 hypothetical protein KP79_PYT23183 [Mizuhopecten yessoensis]
MVKYIDMATATIEENKELSEAFDVIQEYPRNRCEENDEIVQGLTALFENFNKDPKGTPEIILKSVTLARVFSFPKISAMIARSLLVVFRHVWKTYSDFYSVPEHATLSSNLKANAFGFLCNLKDSLNCLISLNGNNSDPKRISTACSEVPPCGTGNEFYAEVQSEFQELKKQKNKEKSEETEARYQAIVDLLDLHCNLTVLKEFVFLYVVILCIANGNSQNTAEGYFEVIEGQRKDRETTLNILFEPEAEFAGVSAVFMNGDWPMLQMHTEKRLSCLHKYFNSLAGKKVKIVSSEDDTFAMFRHPSEKTVPFTQKKYIRIFNDKHSKFIMEKEFALNKTYFVIRLDAERELTLKINDSSKGNLITDKRLPSASGQFNLVRLANGNIMISCMKHPTRFVTMTSAKDGDRLEAKNIGAGLNSQWHIVNCKVYLDT